MMMAAPPALSLESFGCEFEKRGVLENNELSARTCTSPPLLCGGASINIVPFVAH
jgi:hypothetical protein